MAHLQSRLKVSLNTSNVPEECIFNFQGSRRICFSSHYPTDKKAEKFNPPLQKKMRNIENDISQLGYSSLLRQQKRRTLILNKINVRLKNAESFIYL
jgi:hypothetical protein